MCILQDILSPGPHRRSKASLWIYCIVFVFPNPNKDLWNKMLMPDYLGNLPELLPQIFLVINNELGLYLLFLLPFGVTASLGKGYRFKNIRSIYLYQFLPILHKGGRSLSTIPLIQWNGRNINGMDLIAKNCPGSLTLSINRILKARYVLHKYQ